MLFYFKARFQLLIWIFKQNPLLAVTFKRPFEFIWVGLLPVGRAALNLSILPEQQMFCFQLNNNINNYYY